MNLISYIVDPKHVGHIQFSFIIHICLFPVFSNTPSVNAAVSPVRSKSRCNWHVRLRGFETGCKSRRSRLQFGGLGRTRFSLRALPTRPNDVESARFNIEVGQRYGQTRMASNVARDWASSGRRKEWIQTLGSSCRRSADSPLLFRPII